MVSCMVPEGGAISRQGSPDNSRSRSSRAGAERERVRYPSPHPLAARPDGWMHEVGQQDAPGGEIPKGKTHIALGVGGAEIDHRQEPTTGTVPGRARRGSDSETW